MNSENENEDLLHPFSMDNAEDHIILMHRNAHFAGNFDEMISYYKNGGIGSFAEIEIPRIEKLAEAEKRIGKDLAATLLSEEEIEKVERSKKAYIALRDLYEIPSSKNVHARLIADLIFSEDEDPKEEIEAIVKEKSSIVTSLLDLLRSEDFSDPLFPGYGIAPNLAARCLGTIGDKRALISLFEAIGESNIVAEEHILKALKTMGDPAKDFLMKVAQGKPLNRDNEQAAIALLQFADDPNVQSLALKMLHDKNVQNDFFLATHFILICESLEDQKSKEEFITLCEGEPFPRNLKREASPIIKSFQKAKT